MHFRLVLALPVLLLTACQDDPPPLPPTTMQPLSAAPLDVASAAPSASVAPLVSAEPAPIASAAPSASTAPSALPTAEKKSAAPSATAKAEPAPKKDPVKEPAEPAPAAPSASAIASVAPPTAAPSPADLVAAQIDSVFLDKKTFSAKFKQEHTQKVAGVTKKSSGVFFFERPNKMSFRYDAPSTNRIVSDGTTLKVYIGDDKQMFVQPVDKTEYPGAFAFLMGKGLAPSFNFGFNDKAKFDGGPVLLGKPRQPTPHYDSVLFYVDKTLLEKKDPGVIRRILLIDAQGNRNRFDLEGATQPEKIDPAEFTFTPPPGTNITQN
ncbi:MAG: outer membrane lipoprotein carrier protein LolA [Polyangiaceae bacterium]|nr:outer membrane lipoprotein carrier protein LolA [Polyangiaceae bacterium]